MSRDKELNDIADTSIYKRYGLAGGFSMGNQPQADNAKNTQIDVTDIARNKNFHVAKPVAADRVDTNLAAGQKVDVSATKQSAMAVGADYMKEDLKATETLHAGINHACGPETGAQVIGQLTPSGGANKISAVAQVLDPTGMVGAGYSALNEIMAHKNSIGVQTLNEHVEKAMQAIAEAYEAVQEGQQPDIPIYPEHDFEGITAKQAIDFLMRDRTKDPVMAAVQDVIQACDQIENDQDVYVAREHDVITAAKVESAIERGDTQGLQEMEAVKNEEILTAFSENQAQITALEAEMYGETLQYASGVRPQGVDNPLDAVQAARSAFNAAVDDPDSKLGLESEALKTAMAFKNDGMMG